MLARGCLQQRAAWSRRRRQRRRRRRRCPPACGCRCFAAPGGGCPRSGGPPLRRTGSRGPRPCRCHPRSLASGCASPAPSQGGCRVCQPWPAPAGACPRHAGLGRRARPGPPQAAGPPAAASSTCPWWAPGGAAAQRTGGACRRRLGGRGRACSWQEGGHQEKVSPVSVLSGGSVPGARDAGATRDESSSRTGCRTRCTGWRTGRWLGASLSANWACWSCRSCRSCGCFWPPA